MERGSLLCVEYHQCVTTVGQGDPYHVLSTIRCVTTVGQGDAATSCLARLHIFICKIEGVFYMFNTC